MSSIEARKNGAGRTYYVARWRDPEGHQRMKSFARKVDAAQHLVGVDHAKLAHTYVDPKAGKVTFRSYAEQWRANQVHRPSTAAQVTSHLRNHAYPRLGDRPIGAIRTSEIQNWIKWLSVGDDDRPALRPATIEVVVSWVRSVFKAAVADRVVAQSPCSSIRLPEVHRAQVVPLPPSTVADLIATIHPRYSALVVLGAGTGVRIAEALGLTVDRVDFLRRSVLIDRQLLRTRGATPEWGPVKDRQNRPRSIPLGDVVLSALSEHVAAYGTGPDGLVFTNTQGRPLWRTTFGNAWTAAARPLGIPAGEGFHQLRHFYASPLIHRGESVKVVQHRLGHASATITLDTYGHLWPETEDRSRSAVDEVLGRLPRSAVRPGGR